MNLAGCASVINYHRLDLAPGGYLTAAAVTRLQALSPTTQVAAGCTANPLQNIFGSGSTLAGGQIVTDFTTYGGSDNGIIKVDVHANDKNQLNFVWYSGGGNDIVGDGCATVLGHRTCIPGRTWAAQFGFGLRTPPG